MQQVLLRIPIKTEWFPEGIPIYGFGMMLFLAFLLCTWVAGRRAEREGIRKEIIQDIVIWLFLGGLIGARIVYIFAHDTPTGVGDFFYKLPRIWDGGIVFYGSVLGGLAGYGLGYWLVFRKLGISTLKLVDILAPSIALGLCLGRIGCFLNGCCYGQVACADCAVYPVHFPLSAPPRDALVYRGYQTSAGFTFAPRQPGEGARVGQVEPGSPAWQAGLRPGDIILEVNGNPTGDTEAVSYWLGLEHWPRGKTDVTLKVKDKGEPLTFTPRTIGLHPTQLYESVSMFLLFLFLSAVYPFRQREGQIAALLMICYGVHRTLNELLRSDERPVGFERYGSIVLIVAGVALGVWLWHKARQNGQMRLAPA
jgi:phosphatidylglycerol---prolipoprotein diacylglyceryl transferase